MTENLPKGIVLTKENVSSELAVLGGIDIEDIIKLWRGTIPPTASRWTEQRRTNCIDSFSVQHKQPYPSE